ncbi:MAG: FAD-binding oxidoreductase [Proteobacteria bacterium]|nr:FAD-binding oxidoreductase [Pseudomonadota bacterium]
MFEPDRYRQLLSLGAEVKMAVQGGGISLTAASFGGGARVINMRRFNRLLGFDPERGTVEAEAGITLGRLSAFLVKRGFTVPVQPAHPQITLGGCIAANVHGKNPYRDGLFGGLVERLRLFHPAHGELMLSREQNGDLFDLTCGGYGLTGMIVSARIRIAPLGGNCCEVTHIRVADLADTFARLDELKESHDLLYSWNDLARFDRHMGRGYVVAGTFVDREPAPAGPRRLPRLDPHRGSVARLSLINPVTLPALTALYYRASRGAGPRILDLTRALFPAVERTFYFSAYGRAGFIEHQILVPDSRRLDYLGEFEALVRRHRQPIGLASLKLLQGRQRLLHFDGSGVSFCLHLPNRPGPRALLEELDALNSQYGVITNLIKDSRLSAVTARHQYPEFDRFVGRLGAFDPGRLFVSALSERMAI